MTNINIDTKLKQLEKAVEKHMHKHATANMEPVCFEHYKTYGRDFLYPGCERSLELREIFYKHAKLMTIPKEIINLLENMGCYVVVKKVETREDLWFKKRDICQI